jgi:holo-[acyl-carrier protein] synthase
VGEIVGVGLDVVEVDRVRRLLADHPDRFLDRVFTAEEIRYCSPRRNAPECFAGRFALKEAVMKLLGTGWGEGVGFRDIEAVKRPSGAVDAELHGEARVCARKLGIARIHVSISHVKGLAAAVAVGESHAGAGAPEEGRT